LPVQSAVPAVPSSAADAALDELAARAARLRAASGGDLLACFALVPDPRDRRGVRPSLASILAMCTAAVLCGCSSLEDVTARVSAAGPEVLAALGCRRSALGALTPPHPDTIVRVFTDLGVRQLADHAGACLARSALPAPAAFPVAAPAQLPAIAVDGKAVRGAAGADGLVPYLLAAATHRECAVIAERLTGPKTSEVPELAPLPARPERARPPGRARDHRRRRPHRPRPRHAHLRGPARPLRHDRQGQHPRALQRHRCPGLGRRPRQPPGHRDRARPHREAHHPGDGRPGTGPGTVPARPPGVPDRALRHPQGPQAASTRP
jgi:hypothetical protein